MTTRVEVRQVDKEVAVVFCDFCDARIGEPPIDTKGGYMISTSVRARDDKRPMWYGTVCRTCMDELRERSGFDARSR